MEQKLLDRFRKYRKVTMSSEVAGRFLQLYVFDEREFEEQYLSMMDLANCDHEIYKQTIAHDFLVDCSVLHDVQDEEASRALIQEVYSRVQDLNPFVSPHKVRQDKSVSFTIEHDFNPLSLAEARVWYADAKKHLTKNIIGQEEAVSTILASLARATLRSKARRPAACILLAGLSGVGKTEIARQLGQAFGPHGLVRIDCGEYTESHYSAKIMGAPAGYVGYEDDTILDKVDPSGYQVLLFDEFEKAHPRLRSLLLAAMDDGVISTGNNQIKVLYNTFILFTSNLGASEATSSWASASGFLADSSFSKAGILKRIEKELPIEFRNRLDHIVICGELTDDEKERVVEKELKVLKAEYKRLVNVTWKPELIRHIARTTVRERGARGVLKFVEEIGSQLSDLIISSPSVIKKVQIGLQAGTPFVTIVQ